MFRLRLEFVVETVRMDIPSRKRNLKVAWHGHVTERDLLVPGYATGHGCDALIADSTASKIRCKLGCDVLV